MSKLEERENRRKSIVGGMIDGQAKETGTRGRPKVDRELKKRISLSVKPSLYEDIQKIAYVQRVSISDLIGNLMEKYRADHPEVLVEYTKIKKR